MYEHRETHENHSQRRDGAIAIFSSLEPDIALALHTRR